MHDHDDLTDRLTQLGSAPVPDDVRAGHLHAMHAAVPAPGSPRRFGRLAVAAAAFVGFAAGSTGFAMAGALPDPAQRVAHDVLAVVNIEAPDGGWKNHGECVSAHARAGDDAGRAGCKDAAPPGRSGDARGRSGEAPGQRDLPPDHPNSDTSDCKGKPPWAGQGRGPDETERAAREACPADPGEDPAAKAAEDAREREAEAAEDAADAQADAQEQAEEQAEQEAEPTPPADAGPPALPDDVPAEGDAQPEATPEPEPAG